MPVVGQAETITKIKGIDALPKVVIAMPSASAKRVREIVELMTAQGIKVETLPSMEELAAGRVKVRRPSVRRQCGNSSRICTRSTRTTCKRI